MRASLSWKLLIALAFAAPAAAQPATMVVDPLRAQPEIDSMTGITQVRTANIPHLELTQNRVRSVEAPLLERAHMGADGILGVDSLRSQRVMFDFKAKMISIVPSA